jgi:hypothetical protein
MNLISIAFPAKLNLRVLNGRPIRCQPKALIAVFVKNGKVYAIVIERQSNKAHF